MSLDYKTTMLPYFIHLLVQNPLNCHLIVENRKYLYSNEWPNDKKKKYKMEINAEVWLGSYSNNKNNNTDHHKITHINSVCINSHTLWFSFYFYTQYVFKIHMMCIEYKKYFLLKKLILLLKAVVSFNSRLLRDTL